MDLDEQAQSLSSSADCNHMDRLRRLGPLLAIVVLCTACGSESDDAGSRPAAPTGCVDEPQPEETDPDVVDFPVEFEVRGDTAVMVGTIGADIVHLLCGLVADEPQLAEIEVLDVPGSSTPGDETLEAGLVLRSAGLSTSVPADGQLESGGVDLFLAGAERTVEDGACLGVHSTEIIDDDGTFAAADLPRDHPEHEPYLEYFREIGIPVDFYWFTLSAAPPAGVHYLTPDEMERFDVLTGRVPSTGCSLNDVP